MGIFTDDSLTERLLFVAAHEGYHSILINKLVDKIKDADGKTPLEVLAEVRSDFPNDIPLKWIKKKYPWYKIKDPNKTTYEMIKEIMNTPQSIKFILGVMDDH